MLIKTFKVKKHGMAIILAVAVAVCVAVAVAVTVVGGRSNIYTMKTEAQRQEFMKSMGWEVSEEYIECKATVIPEEFNDVYTNYNKLQKEQGFNLEKYKGKTVEIYSYRVYNYEGHENNECMVCTLIIYDGVLIGGDVCCTELDGFMQGLRKA